MPRKRKNLDQLNQSEVDSETSSSPASNTRQQNKKDVGELPGPSPKLSPEVEVILKQAYDRGIADGRLAILHKSKQSLPADEPSADFLTAVKCMLPDPVVDIHPREVQDLVSRAFQEGYAFGKKTEQVSATGTTTGVQQQQGYQMDVKGQTPTHALNVPVEESSCAEITCTSKWVKVYETNAKGKTIFGKKSDLAVAVNMACTIRLHIPEWGKVFAVQNAKLLGSGVAAQSLFNISKATWNTFSESSAWQFIFFNSSGNFHRAEYLLGSHSRPADPDTRGRIGICWFVRYQDKSPLSPEHTRVYCNSSTGNRTEGSAEDLISAVQQGADVRFSTGEYMVPSVNSLSLGNDQLVVAQSLWHVATKHVAGGDAEFQNNAYWWFTMFGTDGHREMSRWNVGEHKNRGHTSDQQEVKWFVDKHWSLAYKHSSNGECIQGSHERLIASVLAGKRVRLVMNDNYATEADNMLVNCGHVSAQLLGNICRDGVGKFWDDEAYWIWHLVSSAGRSDVTQLRVGSRSKAGYHSGASPQTAWYVDDHQYRKVLTTSSGKITAGSKAELINELTQGSMLQLVIHYPDGPVLSFSPDNVEIHEGEVAAQLVRNVGYHDSGDGFRKFTTTAYWHLMLAMTQGTLVTAKWIVGSHEYLGPNEGKDFREDINIDWFIS